MALDGDRGRRYRHGNAQGLPMPTATSATSAPRRTLSKKTLRCKQERKRTLNSPQSTDSKGQVTLGLLSSSASHLRPALLRCQSTHRACNGNIRWHSRFHGRRVGNYRIGIADRIPIWWFETFHSVRRTNWLPTAEAWVESRCIRLRAPGVRARARRTVGFIRLRYSSTKTFPVRIAEIRHYSAARHLGERGTATTTV